MLPIWARVELAIITIIRYFTFPKTPGLKPHHQIPFSVISKTLVEGCLTPSAEVLSVYSTTPVDRALIKFDSHCVFRTSVLVPG